MNKRKLYLALGLIGFFALLVRLWGINFGLPYGVYFRPDEDIIVNYAISFGKGDFNPRWFMYPTFQMYLTFVLYGTYFIILLILGLVRTAGDFANFYYLNPGSFYLIARFLSSFAGAATVISLYYLGKRAYSQRTGLLASLFLAFVFLHVRDSHFARLDALMTFFLVLAFIYVLRLSISGKIKDYLLAGMFAGLSISTKYPAGVILVPMVISHFFANPKKWWNSKLYLMFLSTAFFFFLGTPFAFLNFSIFVKDLLYMSTFAKNGFGLNLGWGWWYNLVFSLRYGLGLPLLIASLSGVALAIWRHQKKEILFLSFILIYYLANSLGKLLFVRYMIPLVPFLCLMAAEVVNHFLNSLTPLKISKFLKQTVTLLLISIILSSSVHSLCWHNWLLCQKDTRILAKEWIEANIPSRTRIAMEGYQVYNFPPLWESKESISERLKGKYKGGRFAFYLDSPSYSRFSQYYLFKIQEGQVEYIDEYTRVPAKAEMLRKERIEYIITFEHPLVLYSSDKKVTEKICQQAYLVKEFSPFKTPGIKAFPLYDQLDAYYVPLARFKGIIRPGPVIRIYQLKNQKIYDGKNQ